MAGGDETDNRADRDAKAAEAGLAAHHFRVSRDPIQTYVLHNCILPLQGRQRLPLIGLKAVANYWGCLGSGRPSLTGRLPKDNVNLSMYLADHVPSMADLNRTLKFRWLWPATHQKQAILKRAKHIDSLKNRGCMGESLKAEHEAIQMTLQSLEAAVISGASRAEVIDVMNAVIAFCSVHFVDEETLMSRSGYSRLDAHVAAHKRLLAKFVAARRSASGEGLSVATLDHLDLLQAFHSHVTVWDRRMAAALSITANRALTAAHG